MNIGEKIRQARKEKNVSQEALAEQVKLSVQAVSKWECNLSCPDIELLPRIADFLGVTLDYLLREGQSDPDAPEKMQLDIPDDDTLRIIQCIGQKVISRDEWHKGDHGAKIPLRFENTWIKGLPLHLEIWGSADIEGSISGDVSAGGSVNCDCVGNNVSAGSNVTCDCVGNNVNAGANVTCDSVGNDVNAGATVNCGDVGGNASSGHTVNCGDVGGNVASQGEIHCCTIEGNVTGGTIYTE